MPHLLDPKIEFDKDFKPRSTLIRLARYSSKSEVLELTFISGHIWRYSPISLVEWTNFRAYRSQGEYFHQHIKNKDYIVAVEVTKGGTQASDVKKSVTVECEGCKYNLPGHFGNCKKSVTGKTIDKQQKIEADKTVTELSRDFHKLMGTLK